MKRAIAALLAGLVVFGGVFAFAAALNVTPADMAAGSETVAACDPGDGATDGVETSYTTKWDESDDRYEVDNVVVSGIAEDCIGQWVQVQFRDADATTGDNLGGSVAAKQVVGTAAVDDESVSFGVLTSNTELDADIPAGLVDQVHVVING